MSDWFDLGPIDVLSQRPLQQIAAGRTKLAVSYVGGRFGVISGVCNHVGGPLGDGRLDGEYVVCPWHNWKFHGATGKGEPGFEEDCVPRYESKVENGRLLVDLDSATRRMKKPHAPHPLTRPAVREPGPMRVVCISTTVMDESNPRYSTSDALLDVAAAHAREELGVEAKVIRLSALKFRACEGYYSKSAQACTWPCSITQMDPNDELDVVYEAIVHWADVILIASPIRWGSASSLYFKMVERMNCIQNQVTIRNRVLLRNKVAAFIITGGQDNVQAVAGQMLGFFAEIGCTFPQFPYIAHSRGWSAEDMERNIAFVKKSDELHEAARELVTRAVDTAQFLIVHSEEEARAGHVLPMIRAGRKASGAEKRRITTAMNLIDSRIQLHHALQPAAGIGRTLLPPRPDDSHSSFMWSEVHGALVQEPAEGHIQSGLRLRDLTLLLIAPGGVSEYPLRGRTLDDAFRFYEERVGRMLARPGESIPDHAVARGALFAPDAQDLSALASMYADAAALLERVRAKHPGASPVRVWPHHFDIATTIAEGERTILAGFVPGDEGIPEPYWYVTAWPAPATPPKLAVGEWHTQGWTGAVLKGQGDVERFLDEAILGVR